MSNMIIAIYVFSTFSHFFISNFVDESRRCSLEAFLLIFFSIAFLVYPLSSFEVQLSKKIPSYINPRKLDMVEKVVIVFCIFSIAFFVQYLGQVFSTGIVEMRSMKRALYESSIFSKCAVMGAFLSPVALFFFFYNQIYRSVSKVNDVLLVLGSVSFIVYTLNVAGRDGIVIWVMTFFALCCLFYPYLTKEIKRKIALVGTAGIACFLPLLIFISSSRFEKSDYGTIVSMMSYIGQGLDNLTYNLEVFQNTAQSSGNFLGVFPIFEPFFRFMGIEQSLAIDTFGKMELSFALGYRANQFSFFIGSLYPSNFSMIGLIVFLVVCFTVYLISLKGLNTSANTGLMLIGFVWYLIPIVGVFYFYYASLIGNVFLLTPFFIWLYLR